MYHILKLTDHFKRRDKKQCPNKGGGGKEHCHLDSCTNELAAMETSYILNLCKTTPDEMGAWKGSCAHNPAPCCGAVSFC